MNDFPDFMKNPANRIATSSQSTPEIEGYVFDGVDGCHMAFCTCCVRPCPLLPTGNFSLPKQP